METRGKRKEQKKVNRAANTLTELLILNTYVVSFHSLQESNILRFVTVSCFSEVLVLITIDMLAVCCHI